MTGEPTFRGAQPGLTELPRDRRRDWIRPRAAEPGLTRALRTLRTRAWVILAVLAVTTGAAVAYLATAPKVYKAQSSLLVTPVPIDDPALAGLGLVRDSTDPTRSVETAAQLVASPDVAAQVIRTLHLSKTPTGLLADVAVTPVAQSNIVAVSASASSPAAAKRLADTFADTAVAQRGAALRAQIDALIPQLQAQLASVPVAQRAQANALANRIAELSALRATGDPTIRPAARAELPTALASPRRALSIAAGIAAGLVLGIGAALALELLDPRIRREEQLHELYRLPVLARIPRARRRARGVIHPQELSPAAVEAYRRLRHALMSARGDAEPRAVLVTGPSAAEGKTTTSLNLAISLAATGEAVVLVEGDLRRPMLGRTLEVEVLDGMQAVLRGDSTPSEAVVRYRRQTTPALDVLLSERSDGDDDELLSDPRAADMVRALKEQHDWVVVDAPSMNVVGDAWPLVRAADDVLIVVRLGKSKLPQLRELTEFLAQQGIEPAGFVVLGVEDAPARRGETHPARGSERRPRSDDAGRLIER